MEVILKEDVANLGHRGDVVKVADGYGRNFLLPRKLALQATVANKAVIDQMKAAAARRSATEKTQAEELVTKLQPVVLTFTRKSGEQGHLFGSVTATDIAKELQNQKFNIEPEDVLLPGRLDRIDTYTVRIKFAEDLAADLKVWVNADPESKAAIDAARKAGESAPAEEQ